MTTTTTTHADPTLQTLRDARGRARIAWEDATELALANGCDAASAPHDPAVRAARKALDEARAAYAAALAAR